MAVDHTWLANCRILVSYHGTGLVASWLIALDAVLLLIHPLSSWCHGRGRTRGDEGPGLLGPFGGCISGSSLSITMFIRTL